MSDYKVVGLEDRSTVVQAGYPLAAAEQVHDITWGDRITVQNVETGTVCLVDFDLVKTWKEII